MLEVAALSVAAVSYVWEIRYGCDRQEIGLIYILVFSLKLGKISDFLGNKLNVYLGNLSMYIYLIHYVVINCGGKQLVSNFAKNGLQISVGCIRLFAVWLMASIVIKKISTLQQ